jgi:cytoskeletal protein CcmA (bactofilin family)
MGIFGKPSENPPHEGVTPPKAAPSPQPSALAPRPSSSPCVIGSKTVIKGEVLGEEDVLVEGTIEGQVRIGRDLRIGPGGVVKATVEAQAVVVSGELIGDCAAQTRIEIQATGKLTGNIRAPKIVVAEGAMFRGNSDMSGRKDERKDKIIP